MTPTPHRRRFVRDLLVGGIAADAVAASALAGVDGPPPARSEVDARMDLITARYGRHLDEPARAAIRREVERQVERSSRLRLVPLGNADEPAPTFSAIRPPAD